MPKTLITSPPRQSALVVEPDRDRRVRLCRLLREHGMEVVDCADVAEGRELFADQRLVMAPLNGDNSAMKEFVAWVRAEAGVSQPWIIAVGEKHELGPGETPAHYGVNDLFTGPMDTATLVGRLEAIGLGRTARPALPAPPSYQRTRTTAPAVSVAPAWDGASAHVLLEHFPAAVAILDRSMKYLSVNQRWITEFQIPTNSLTGALHYDIFPDLHPDWLGLYERCLAGDEKQVIDDLMPRPDGSESLVHWEIQPWHDTAGAVGGLVLTCAAVEPPPVSAASGPPGAPVQAPPARQAASDESFREMAEAAPFGMILLDDEAHVIYANPQHRSVLGFAVTEDEPVQSWLERACAGDTVFQKRALDEWWESVWRRRTALTCSLRNAEGLVKDIEFRPAALSGDRLLLTIFDVTDARLDEQAVRTSEARYRGLFQQASAALLMINPAGNLTEVNPAFETLTGWPRQEARRAALTDFLPATTITHLRDATLAGGAAEGFRTVLYHRSGSLTPVYLSLAVIRNDQGQPAFTACLLAPIPEPAAVTTAAATAGAETAGSPAAWENITPDWLFLLDADGVVLDHTTTRDFATLQTAARALKGEPLESVLPELTAALPLEVMMERVLDTPELETRCEYTFSSHDQSAPRRIEARLLLVPGGTPHRFGLTFRDVTRARQATSPGGFNATLLEHLRSPAILTNQRGRILHLNPAAEALTGYTTSELREGGLYRLFRPDSPKGFSAELTSHLQAHRGWHASTSMTSKDGTVTKGMVELTAAFDEASDSCGFILLFRPEAAAMAAAVGSAEITPAPPVAPMSPPASLTLHRARNDLQVLTSLISLQLDHTGDPGTRQALRANQDRLSAIALIYRMIQHEQDPVDFARFCREIGRVILDTHGRSVTAISLEPLFIGVLLPQRMAITLGLIVEELITGCLIWSFPHQNDSGHIRITLTLSENEGTLILSENGSTPGPEQRAQREESFSHRIIQLLAGQIGGSLTLLENQVRLRFTLPAASS